MYVYMYMTLYKFMLPKIATKFSGFRSMFLWSQQWEAGMGGSQV